METRRPFKPQVGAVPHSLQAKDDRVVLGMFCVGLNAQYKVVVSMNIGNPEQHLSDWFGFYLYNLQTFFFFKAAVFIVLGNLKERQFSSIVILTSHIVKLHCSNLKQMPGIFMIAQIVHQQSVMLTLNLIITALVAFMQFIRECQERAFHSNCAWQRLCSLGIPSVDGYLGR